MMSDTKYVMFISNSHVQNVIMSNKQTTGVIVCEHYQTQYKSVGHFYYKISLLDLLKD